MSSEIHPKYRPDIDGLRALAILIVVFFHAFPTILTGGFVGVDIFFVISGYLISTIIFKETDKGIFSFRNFYARRVNRIFPAFLVVLFFCLVTGWLFLFPEEIKKLGKHAFNGSIFLLNINLFQENGYFEPSSELKPLMHLWSLCVEEQYYLLWPIIVLAFWKRTAFRMIAIIACIILSFVTNLYFTNRQPDVAFYLSIPRFWELLFGSLLAYLVIYKSPIFETKKVVKNLLSTEFFQHSLSTIGIALIVTSVTLLDQTKNFPGYWALLPVIGATLLIAAPHGWFNKIILSNRIVIFIGLISYPLYLWHWPLLSFAKIWIGSVNLNNTLVFAVLALSFILAACTYLFIEKPIRNLPASIKTKSLLLGWIVMIVLSLAIYKNWTSPRLYFVSDPEIVTAKDDWHYPLTVNASRQDKFEFLDVNPNQPKRVLFWGDSHMEHYWSRINYISHQQSNNKITSRFITAGGCPVLPEINRTGLKVSCANLYRFAMDQALDETVKTIVISSFWELYFNQAYQISAKANLVHANTNVVIDWGSHDLENTLTALINDIQKLRSKGKTVYIVLSNPTSKDFDPANLISRWSGKSKDTITYKDDYLNYTSQVRDKILHVIKESGAIAIDPVPHICPGTVCHGLDNGKAIYKDSDHLNDSYSKFHASFMDQTLQ